MTAELAAWARVVAAKLSPFNAEVIAELGAIAARLDAKRAADDKQAEQ